jgi:hypothetical protein
MLLGALLVLLAAAGIGSALAVLRIVVPGPGEAAERAARGLGPRRLLLLGVLPLVGAVLLAHAVGALPEGTRTGLGIAYLLVVALPLGLLLLAGAAGAVPYLGGRLLGDRERSLWARAVAGAVALALCGWTAVLPPLLALVSALVLGWFLGAGLAALLARRAASGGPAPG